MHALLELTITLNGEGIRKAACSLFNLITTNNTKVQVFASRYGAVNLLGQLEREQTPAMREAILSSLSAFLKAENFPGKRQFITEIKGLETLIEMICLKGEAEKEAFGQAAQLRKIRLKLIQLLYDFVLNDDSIINDGFYVRGFMCNHQEIIPRIIKILQDSSLEVAQEH